MPITITPGVPTGVFTPGQRLDWSSDFIGPLESGAQLITTLGPDPEGVFFSWKHTIPIFTTSGSFNMMISVQDNIGTQMPTHGETAYVNMQITEPTSGVVDSGSESKTWDAVSGLPIQNQQLMTQLLNHGIGLSGSSDTALQAIDTRTQTILGDEPATITDAEGAHPFTIPQLFTGKALDQITLAEVTSGPTFDPVSSAGVPWFFGVIIRIATVPPNAIPITPDGDYYIQDLAVLRVFRGTDVEERYPIHRSSQLIPFHNLYAGVVLNETLLFPNPPDTSLEVDWAPGVSGQVFLMQFP